MKKALSIIFCLMIALSSCNKFPSHKEDVHNAAFEETVNDAGAKIDPKQNWVASSGYQIKGLTVTNVPDIEIGFTSCPTKADQSNVRHPAEYFKVIWGHGTRRFLIRIEEPGTGVTEYGVYYYDMDDNRIDIPISVTGSNQIDFDDPDHAFFGVYIVKNGERIYSESRWNEGLRQCCTYIAREEDKSETSNRAYIYLDDVTFKSNSNDDICGLDYDRGPWMVICEDIGNENTDNDFNDVVFIVHRRDSTHIKVEYCATGATLNDVIVFNHNALGEIHELLNIESGTMINENEDSEPHTYSAIIEVPKTFTMSQGDFGGFSINCGGISNAVHEIGETGYAPYMIVVPSYMKWCREAVSIFTAYPEFLGWVEDHTRNTDWFMHPVEDKVVQKAE